MTNTGSELRVPAPCPACASGPSPAAWHELPLVEVIASATIQRHVSAWPAHATIEVRRCSGCGRGIARTVPRR